MAPRLLFVLLGAALVVADPSAQTPAPPAGAPAQAPFRARVDSVTVDVVVTDKSGKPVSDLKAEDFEVTENKKLQAVQTFKLIRVDDDSRPEPTVSEITSLDAMARETARDDVRVIVIFLDDYHVRRGNAMRIRQDLARFVSEGLTPHDLVAIMYPLTPLNAITFSRNHDGTASALMGFEGRKYEYQPKNAYEERYAEYPPEAQELLRRQITTSGLEGLATYLGTLRDGKKQILFVSEGLYGTLPPGVRTTGAMNNPVMPTGSQQAQDRTQFLSSLDVLDEMKRVFAAAAKSNSSIYTLDPRGLATSEFQINDNVSSDNDRRFLSDSINSLRTISENTDGRAIVNANDPATALRQMLTDSSAYYLLGYTSTESARDGKFHEIQVKVKRKDIQVRARKGYWAYTPDDMAKAEAPVREGPPPAVELALNTLADMSHARSIRTWLGAERGENGKAMVTFAWEATADAATDAATRNPTMRGPDPDAVDHITLVATSIYGDKLYSGPIPRDAAVARPGGRVMFEAPGGGVKLQIVAENAAGQRVDRDEQNVDVPDFSGAGTQLTTPAVFRARTARDLQQLRAAIAPMPAILREFSRTERLLIRFGAYGPGGAEPTVTMRLINTLGKEMAVLPAPNKLAAGRYEGELGLGSLATGQYLIEIAAAVGEAKTQTLIAIRVTN